MITVFKRNRLRTKFIGLNSRCQVKTLDSAFFLVYNFNAMDEKSKFDYSELYEEYGSLLTERQADAFNLYYLCDLSISEISELKGISRQAVNDFLGKAREALETYEKNLKLLQKKRELAAVAKNVEGEQVRAEILKLIGEL